MTGFSNNDPATILIAEKLADSFVLLDVGCSGGILPAWRAFGKRLQAFAFDPNLEEVERLRKKETHAGVVYEDAFVGVPEGHPRADQMARQDFVRNSPWDRLSVADTLDRRTAAIAAADNVGLTQLNQWRQTSLTSRSIYLPEYLRARKVADVDFVKLDIDGGDFIVLQTMFESPIHAGILGMLLEVNFHGTAESGHHTFHNTDRYMREMGFDLFDLSVRTYSSKTLPWPYAISAPAQTTNGRPFQGDALYMRDITAPNMSDYAAGLSAEKIAKVAAIFSLSGHYDQAAEVLSHFAGRLKPIVDVDGLLDVLAQQIQRPLGTSLSRSEYLTAFGNDSAMFYPGWQPQPDVGALASVETLTALTSAPEVKTKPKPAWRRMKKKLKKLLS